MATSGDAVEHPVTGEKITFLETSGETGGEYATFELRVRPHNFVATPHVHPIAEEPSRYAPARSRSSWTVKRGRFERKRVRPCQPAQPTPGGTLAKRRAWLSSSFVRP